MWNFTLILFDKAKSRREFQIKFGCVERHILKFWGCMRLHRGRWKREQPQEKEGNETLLCCKLFWAICTANAN